MWREARPSFVDKKATDTENFFTTNRSGGGQRGGTPWRWDSAFNVTSAR